jgi:hypothetical protein
VKSLTNLTKKGKFKWDDQASQAMQNLKIHLLNDVMLNYPDQSKRFFLDTEASDHTIGAVLSDHHQLIRPVGFYSRKLLDAELNSSVYDLLTVFIDLS